MHHMPTESLSRMLAISSRPIARKDRPSKAVLRCSADEVPNVLEAR